MAALCCFVSVLVTHSFIAPWLMFQELREQARRQQEESLRQQRFDDERRREKEREDLRKKRERVSVCACVYVCVQVGGNAGARDVLACVRALVRVCVRACIILSVHLWWSWRGTCVCVRMRALEQRVLIKGAMSVES